MLRIHISVLETKSENYKFEFVSYILNFVEIFQDFNIIYSNSSNIAIHKTWDINILKLVIPKYPCFFWFFISINNASFILVKYTLYD